jgi:hypothetical protein
MEASMSWERVDDKVKKKLDREFVSCQEAYELRYVREAIKEIYPGRFTEAKIDAAIQSCCVSIKAPRPRAKFVQCVLKQLGV